MITTDRDGDILTVTLDRPKRRNALTPAALRELEAAVASTDAPVVYLTGAGPSFCAGADFSVIEGLDRDTAAEFARLGQSVTRCIESAETVVVAGIDGPARGGGVELALAADVRIATPSATFAETGAGIGLFGAWGGTVRLPEVVGTGWALDLSLSGRTLSAEDALAAGLVTRLTDEPRRVAEELAGQPTRSLRAIKRLMRTDENREARFAREVDSFAELVDAGPALPD